MSLKTIKDVTGLLILGAVGIGIYSVWPTPEQMAKSQQESAVRAEEYKREQAEKEVREQAAALVKDTAAAARMQTTLEHYRWGKERSLYAATACQTAVEEEARYGYRSDWLSNYVWSVNPILATYAGKSDEAIYIEATDLQFKNAFNAQEYMRYSCVLTTDHKIPSQSLSSSAWTAHVLDIAPLKGGR